MKPQRQQNENTTKTEGKITFETAFKSVSGGVCGFRVSVRVTGASEGAGVSNL